MNRSPEAARPIVDTLTLAMLRPEQERGALFLDRDGVINIDYGYVHTKEQTEWVPGIFDLARMAYEAGMVVVVVTNQAGIARGYYDDGAFRDYTEWMHAEFRRRAAPLLATYYCPHHPEPGNGRDLRPCACRKPAPGMLFAAFGDFAIHPSRSVLVGDKSSDLEAAEAAGISDHFLVREPNLSDAVAWFSCREELR